MSYSREEIQRVREISIAGQIAGGSPGRRYKIQCPFDDHNDKTPSFLIDEDNGYHCFGCGRHGRGWIDFVTELIGRDCEEGEIFRQIMEEYAK